ncbi:hypothetical protein ABBQ32_000364 [Trebouxia sp. C0010 RCD-2024]
MQCNSDLGKEPGNKPELIVRKTRRAAQAEHKQCVRVAESATAVEYQLTLPTSDLAGPGQLTVTLEHAPFQSSTYLHLTGDATRADIRLGWHHHLYSKDATLASTAVPSTAQPGMFPSLTVPVPLQHGSAIQLRAHHGQQTTEIPYYAVSEELLLELMPPHSLRKALPSQTPYDGSLLARIGVQAADKMLCPATPGRSNVQHQQHGPRQVPEAPMRQASAFPALSGQQKTPSVWLPWGVSLCLGLCIIALLIKIRQVSLTVSRRDAGQQATVAAQTGADHEPSFVKSNWPMLDPTPTKDTGSSPFVPVTHFQAPVPHWPQDTAHLASCSSKIGSYRQKARPATSRAVTNLTSNVSGATKWQRNKNGRLLSLALDPDEHNS